MKKRYYGPSLYFASDKNIYDALNQRKVDIATVKQLFEDRNIIVSPKTPRENLAKYFARLTHDFEDHQKIAARLGIAARRERITSMEAVGIDDKDALVVAIQELKKERELEGDVIQVTREDNNWSLTFQYTTIDYARNEFSQVQVRDGIIELLESPEGYTIRCTQNDFICEARDSLLGFVEKSTKKPIATTVVSLFDVLDVKLRSQFFDLLTNHIPEYKRIDVIAAYVYKPKPEDPTNTDDEPAGEPETHVEKVTMKGSGVTRAEFFNKLLAEEQYYITKVVWTSSKVLSTGAVYEIEAAFDDPKDCTGFSFMLSGVYAVEDGVVGSKKRAPLTSEIDAISRVIDVHSRAVTSKIKQKSMKARNGES
jgi:hypothetical protein